MSDWFYRAVRCLGYPAFGTSSSPVMLNTHHLRRPGGLLVAPNHLSPYDIPCLMACTQRVIDFVSVTEMFRHPLVAWFFARMGALPLDRWRPDAPTVRRIVDRLQRGRLVVMFPEGGIRTPKNSMLAGGSFKPGAVRIAQLAGCPIVPCVILGTSAYWRVESWLPLRATVYAVNFGRPIEPESGAQGAHRMTCRLRQAYPRLLRALQMELKRRGKRLTVEEFPTDGCDGDDTSIDGQA